MSDDESFLSESNDFSICCLEAEVEVDAEGDGNCDENDEKRE